MLVEGAGPFVDRIDDDRKGVAFAARRERAAERMHQQVLAESPPLVSLIDRETSEQCRGEGWVAREFPCQGWRKRARLDSRRGERIVNDCLPRCGSERHQPAIATLQRQLLMQRSGTERLKMGCTMFDTARALMRAGLGDETGLDRSPTMRVRLFERTYGREFNPVASARIVAHLLGTADGALNIRNAEAERLHDEAAPRQAPR